MLEPGAARARRRRPRLGRARALETLDRELRAPVAARHPPVGALLLTGHAHLDLAWRWPLEETRRKAQRTLSTALRMLERHPEMTFNQSTAQLYAFLEEDDPALLERLVEAAQRGALRADRRACGSSPTAVMPTGESLARQLLYGQRYFRSKFGAEHTVCWMPDCFGFTPGLPQLLASAGITHFFTIKLELVGDQPLPATTCSGGRGWTGRACSRTCSRTPTAATTARSARAPALATWRNFKGKDALGESLLSIGFGDGGGGPTEEMIERVARAGRLPGAAGRRASAASTRSSTARRRRPPRTSCRCGSASCTSSCTAAR